MDWLDDWQYRVKISIDPTNIDEDLTDFPLMIKLSNNAGKNGDNLSFVFDKLNYEVNGDSFDGIDNGSPNSKLWYENPSANGTIKLINNRLHLYQSTAGGSSEYTYIKSKFMVSGNFDIIVDFYNITSPSQNDSGGELKIRTYNENLYMVIIKAGYTSDYSSAFRNMIRTNGSDSSLNINRNNDYGKFRIKRTGTNVVIYVIDGDGDWYPTFSGTNWTTEDVFIFLGNYSAAGANGVMSSEFDNLIISGSITWPFNNFPNRKKIAITDNENNQLYTEISSWTNFEAVLWTKVPHISSSGVTDLYLYYDRNKEDNTSYVGDSGDLVVRNVWSNGFKGVYHLSGNPPYSTAIVYDSVNGYNGQSYGGMGEISIKNGKIENTALYFDGSDDYIKCNGGYNFASDLTLEAVFRYMSGYWGMLVKNRGNEGYELDIADDDGIRFVIDGGSSTMLDARYTINNSQYFYAVGRYYHNTRQMNIFINSINKASTTSSYSLGNGYSYIKIGGDNNYFNGNIDEIRVSNVARSNAWIKATYHSLWDNILDYGSEEGFYKSYKYYGYVLEKGKPTRRLVRLYNRISGELMDEGYSSSVDGYYELLTTISGEHFIVAFDDAGGKDYNAIILDRMMPRGIK